MANADHLALLKRGEDSWNQFRQKFPDIILDLSSANLRGLSLSQLDLSQTLLKKANLIDTNLVGVNLNGANLAEADLRGAFLQGASLQGANLVGADLRRTQLVKADLTGANLTQARLAQTDLTGVLLIGGNLSEVDLNAATLDQANLSRCHLFRTQLNGASLRGAILTDAHIEDWEIDATTSLEGVICEQVLWREPGASQPPQTMTFAPGEFSRYLQNLVGTVELVFRNGINWRAFAIAFRDLLLQESQVVVRSIENRDDGIVIRFRAPLIDKRTLAEAFKQSYQKACKRFQQRRRPDAIGSLLDLLSPETALPPSPAPPMRSAAAPAKVAPAKPSEPPKSVAPTPALAKTAAAAGKILQQLSQAYPLTTPAKREAVIARALERLDRSPVLKVQLINRLKIGQAHTLEQFIDHPLAHELLMALQRQSEEGSTDR